MAPDDKAAIDNAVSIFSTYRMMRRDEAVSPIEMAKVSAPPCRPDQNCRACEARKGDYRHDFVAERLNQRTAGEDTEDGRRRIAGRQEAHCGALLRSV
jgi:hypothetical protein